MYCIRPLARAHPGGESPSPLKDHANYIHWPDDEERNVVAGRWFRLFDDITPAELGQLRARIRCTAFSLQVRTQHYTDANAAELCLFLHTNRPSETTTAAAEQCAIIERFFDVRSGPAPPSAHESLDIPIKVENFAEAIPQIYRHLRLRHHADSTTPAVAKVIEGRTQRRLCKGLLPTLRQYQIDAVNWMLHRERQPAWLTGGDLLEIVPKTVDNVSAGVGLPSSFHCDRRTGRISESAAVALPSGGILADEMGLGKTVEMLALMLANPRRMPAPGDELNAVASRSTTGGARRAARDRKSAELWCVCGKTKRKDDVHVPLIRCNNCGLHQHADCIGPIMHQPAIRYVCPDCWQQPAYLNGRLVESKATVVVTPAAIKMQWQQEIERHVHNSGLRVLIYEGVKRGGWINPDVLATYDVIIIDYDVLRTELYFRKSNRRQPTGRRNGQQRPRYLPVRTPLLLVHWWRVCLDESQMVESPSSHVAQMVNILPATHRWAVTGTPIEKSLDTLFTLVGFLGVPAYDDRRVWQTDIVAPFARDQIGPLVGLLQHIMWRNCKANVKSALGIPPQTFRTHLVEMTDLQAFFYRSQHALCVGKFGETVDTVLGRVSLGVSLDTLIGRMTPGLLKMIMEPLRILRQDCTVPSVLREQIAVEVHGHGSVSSEELHRRLMSKHVIECKNQLRTVVSNLNGLAALDAIDSDYKAAIAKYRVVLRYAAENTDAICVDSLLQIHALHNLIQLSEMDDAKRLSAAELETYSSQIRKLKRKYTATSHELVAKEHHKLHAAKDNTQKLSSKYEHQNVWWCTALTRHAKRSNLNTLVQDIPQFIYAEPTVSQIKLILATWLADVVENRNRVQDAFASLEFFEQNIRSHDRMSATDAEHFNHFVRSALDCHLDEASANMSRNRNTAANNGTALDDRPNAAQVLCEMCLVRRKLIHYECVIFDKTMDKTDLELVRGTWNSSREEGVLRALLGQLRNHNATKYHILIKHGESHLALLDAYKAEYKEYSSLWVEINYAVAAFDELNMCQLRMRSVNEIGAADLQEPLTRVQTRLLLDAEQVGLKRAEFTAAESEAQLCFVRTKGTIKYLNHLQQRRQNAEPIDVCPVCTTQPSERYAVMLCGHHVCIVCLLHLTDRSLDDTNKLVGCVTCPVCRNRQLRSDIYYVNTKSQSQSSDAGIAAIGDHPPKITAIVQTVLQLLRDDAAVKVLIFSDWEHILVDIADALTVNNCNVRKRSNPLHKCVNDFKDKRLGVSCLLLPLSSGSKGLNLVEATHVFLVEPILDPAVELQAIGRVDRIGQTRPTTVHRFIMRETIEETIYKTLIKDETTWRDTKVTMGHLFQLFGQQKGD